MPFWLRSDQFCIQKLTLVGSIIPFSTMFTYSPFIASYPISGGDVSILATTTDPSTPAFVAIVKAGIRKARFTILMPVFCQFKRKAAFKFNTNYKKTNSKTEHFILSYSLDLHFVPLSCLKPECNGSKRYHHRGQYLLQLQHV